MCSRIFVYNVSVNFFFSVLCQKLCQAIVITRIFLLFLATFNRGCGFLLSSYTNLIQRHRFFLTFICLSIPSNSLVTHNNFAYNFRLKYEICSNDCLFNTWLELCSIEYKPANHTLLIAIRVNKLEIYILMVMQPRKKKAITLPKE